MRSTGCTDPGAAAKEGAKIYSDVVTGRRVTAPVSTALDAAVAAFLVEYSTAHAEGTGATVENYFRASILPFFGTFERFSEASYRDYMGHRIQSVTRSTLRKELSALRMFVAWGQTHGIELPPVPNLPKHGHPGVRAKNARKAVATILTEKQIKRILMAMPDRSRRTGELVRPFFTLMWETGLRESTLMKLRTPEHFTKGSARLFISRDIDKAHYERHVPLTKGARQALDRAYPAYPGLIFPGIKKDSLQDSIDAALRIAGIEGLDVSPYDFRHSRTSQLANTPGVHMPGVSYLVGHTNLATTSKYVRVSEESANAALALVSGRAGIRSGIRTPKSGSKPSISDSSKIEAKSLKSKESAKEGT
jgi:integrase